MPRKTKPSPGDTHDFILRKFPRRVSNIAKVYKIEHNKSTLSEAVAELIERGHKSISK